MNLNNVINPLDVYIATWRIKYWEFTDLRLNCHQIHQGKKILSKEEYNNS